MKKYHHSFRPPINVGKFYLVNMSLCIFFFIYLKLSRSVLLKHEEKTNSKWLKPVVSCFLAIFLYLGIHHLITRRIENKHTITKVTSHFSLFFMITMLNIIVPYFVLPPSHNCAVHFKKLIQKFRQRSMIYPVVEWGRQMITFILYLTSKPINGVSV